jgi:hypothetical protein
MGNLTNYLREINLEAYTAQAKDGASEEVWPLLQSVVDESALGIRKPSLDKHTKIQVA